MEEFNKIIETIEAAHLELRQAAKIVFKNMATVRNARGLPEDHYKGEYCFPFYEGGSYYYEGPDTHWPNEHYCFLPKKIDDDMRRFINALRDLDTKIRPMFAWKIEKSKHNDDKGNLVFGDVRGWCYQGHGVSTRRFHGHAALVGSIVRGVYKDAFLFELIELAKKKGAPLNKNDFASVQAFSH